MRVVGDYVSDKWENIDEDIIIHVAEIARLRLTPEEVKKYAKDLRTILESFSIIEGIDVEGVEPSFQPLEVKNVFREDVIREGVSREEALSNTSNKEDGYFKGPKAIE